MFETILYFMPCSLNYIGVLNLDEFTMLYIRIPYTIDAIEHVSA